MVLKKLLEKGNNQVEVVYLSIIKGYISFSYDGKKGRVFEIQWQHFCMAWSGIQKMLIDWEKLF